MQPIVSKRPWKYVKECQKTKELEIYFHTIQDADGKNITRFSSSAEGEANAKLIVFAVNNLRNRNRKIKENQRVEAFIESIQSQIDYFKREYDLMLSEALGCLEIIKQNLYQESIED